MSDNGYIYILINPSMEGLIKVGKTNRDPQTRADELSKATGVPTNFVVGYQLEVKNCTRAEEFVHAWLEKKGYRINQNREFFNAPMTEAINAILEYKKIDKEFNDECNILENNNHENYPAWADEEKDAMDAFLGNGNVLQNYNVALKHFKMAIKLGSVQSYRFVGVCFKNGYGCSKSPDVALEYFTEGAEHGDDYCYGEMADLYFWIGHIENAIKCWNRYLEVMENDPFLPTIACNYMGHCLKNGMEPTLQSVRKMHKRMNDIIPSIQAVVNMFQRTGAYSVDEIQNQSNFKSILNYSNYVNSVQETKDIIPYSAWVYNSRKQSKSSTGCLVFVAVPMMLIGLTIYYIV